MDDIDVTVKWGSLDAARESFVAFKPSVITKTTPHSFTFSMHSSPVDVMAYESKTGLGNFEDRTQVSIGGRLVWSKSVDFYKKHMVSGHYLESLVTEYLKQKHSI